MQPQLHVVRHPVPQQHQGAQQLLPALLIPVLYHQQIALIPAVHGVAGGVPALGQGQGDLDVLPHDLGLIGLDAIEGHLLVGQVQQLHRGGGVVQNAPDGVQPLLIQAAIDAEAAHGVV